VVVEIDAARLAIGAIPPEDQPHRVQQRKLGGYLNYLFLCLVNIRVRAHPTNGAPPCAADTINVTASAFPSFATALAVLRGCIYTNFPDSF